MRKAWDTKTWNEVLSIINGKNQKNVEDSNGIYPIYGSGGIMGYANDFLCPNNTVIIGRKGNINKPIFVEEKFWNVDTAFGLVPKEGILNAKYLFFFCVNYNFEKLNKAVTIPSLTKSDLLNIKIDLPPFQTQQQIVEELDSLTSIIEKQKKQLEELDNLAQAIFYDMFGDPMENEKGWNIKKMKDISLSVNYGTSSPSTDDGKYKYLRMNNITAKGTIDLSSIKYINVPLEDLEKYVVRKGDILFNRTNSKELVGKTALYTFEEDMIIAGYIIRLRVIDSIVLPIFLSSYMNTPCIKEYFRSIAKGAVNQSNINSKQLLSTSVFIPPLPLQQQFASKIEAIEKQKELIKKSIKETEDLFNSRMDYYFN